jgi:F0F1-type ATP synthase membrane subunit b/b'
MPNPSHNYEHAVTQLRWRIQRVLLLKYLLQGLIIALFVQGTVIIACRAAGITLIDMLAVGSVPVLTAVIVAAVLAWRKVPDRKKLIAAIDCESEGGGLLMSLAELGTLGDWNSQLRDMKTPRYRWRSRKTFGFLAMALVFAGFALLLPDKTVNALAGPRKLDITNQVQDIDNKLEKLLEEKILDADKVEELKEELKRIQQNAEADGPIKTWEAIDHLNDKLAREAQNAAEELYKEQEKYETVEAMAEALKEQLASEENQHGPTAGEMQDLANEMSNMLGDIAGGDKFLNDLKQQIDEQGLDSLTQDQLEQLAGKMSENCRDCQGRLSNLKNGRMVDPNRLKNFSECNPCDSKSLKDFLDSQCQGACSAEGECDGDLVGRGGISRGPGAAKLNFNHNTQESDAEMKERALEPDYVDMEASIKMGVTRNAPTPNREGSAGEEGGAVTDTEGVAGSSGRDAVLPKHRGAVKRFFDTGTH